MRTLTLPLHFGCPGLVHEAGKQRLQCTPWALRWRTWTSRRCVCLNASIRRLGGRTLIRMAVLVDRYFSGLVGG